MAFIVKAKIYTGDGVIDKEFTYDYCPEDDECLNDVNNSIEGTATGVELSIYDLLSVSGYGDIL